jgi:site-specific DNA-cytosine methylase
MADRDKSYCIDANYFKGGSMKMYYEKARRQIVYVDGQRCNKSGVLSKGCRQVGEADLKGYDIIKRVYSRWGKSPTLTTMQGGWRMPKVECDNWINQTTLLKDNADVDELFWRALTPLECERLQTLPDEWTQYGDFYEYEELKMPYETVTHRVRKTKRISNSQRYKMIGNGFTRAVISHILEGVYS